MHGMGYLEITTDEPFYNITKTIGATALNEGMKMLSAEGRSRPATLRSDLRWCYFRGLMSANWRLDF